MPETTLPTLAAKAPPNPAKKLPSIKTPALNKLILTPRASNIFGLIAAALTSLPNLVFVMMNHKINPTVKLMAIIAK